MEDRMKKEYIASLLACVIFIAGCGEKTHTDGQTAEIPAVFVSSVPAGTPVPIPEARSRFKPGDDVVLSGLVMGTLYPFVEGRGVFVIGDEEILNPCDTRPGDSCPTPWDVCCDPAESRIRGTATIQILDADGEPLRRGVKGIKGLTELSRVTVAGTVAGQSTPEAFIVNATAVHVTAR
jgi:hypothetical protein